MPGSENKIRCYKEQYSTGNGNVRSMNQGKLDMVKQEMTRMNTDILGTSELKWTGMGEFNSDDHYIYYCGQESLRRNAVALLIHKRVKNAIKKVKLLRHVRLFATPWTAAYQAPPSMGFSRQEYWSGLQFSFSRGSSQPRDQTRVSCILGRHFNL